MPENSSNLVDMIREYMTGGFITKMSSVLGENADRTRMGIGAAVPGLLSGLTKAASTSEGARRLTSAVDDADQGLLSNPLGLFTRGLSSESGSSILRSIMGAVGLSELTNGIEKTSGLSGAASASMIGLLAPIVFAVIRKLKNTGGSASDIASLLASQKTNIAAAMPEDMVEETYAGPRAAPRRRETETYTRAERHRSSWAWILPLALLAGALGLLWHFAAQPRQPRAFVPPSTVHAGSDEGGVLSMNALKTKYRSVLLEAHNQGIRLSDMSVQNGKLFIKGIAPTQEAADKVWDEIKRVDPGLNNIVANFEVATPAASTSSSLSDQSSSHPYSTPATEPLSQGVIASSESQTYTVLRGDTLTSISKHFYGNTKDYMRIFNANRGTIENKNLLRPGQELTIPMQ